MIPMDGSMQPPLRSMLDILGYRHKCITKSGGVPPVEEGEGSIEPDFERLIPHSGLRWPCLDSGPEIYGKPASFRILTKQHTSLQLGWRLDGPFDRRLGLSRRMLFLPFTVNRGVFPTFHATWQISSNVTSMINREYFSDRTQL